MIINKS